MPGKRGSKLFVILIVGLLGFLTSRILLPRFFTHEEPTRQEIPLPTEWVCTITPRLPSAIQGMLTFYSDPQKTSDTNSLLLQIWMAGSGVERSEEWNVPKASREPISVTLIGEIYQFSPIANQSWGAVMLKGDCEQIQIVTSVPESLKTQESTRQTVSPSESKNPEDVIYEAKILSQKGEVIQAASASLSISGESSPLLNEKTEIKDGSMKLKLKFSELEPFPWNKKLFLTIDAEGYYSERKTLPSPKTGVCDLGTVILKPTFAIRARVIDENGNGVAYAKVIDQYVKFHKRKSERGSETAKGSQWKETDREGYFEITKPLFAPDRSVFFLINHPDYALTWSELRTLRDSFDSEWTLRIQRGKTIEASVVDQYGNGVSGVTVRISSPTFFESYFEIESDPEGKLAFRIGKEDWLNLLPFKKGYQIDSRSEQGIWVNAQSSSPRLLLNRVGGARGIVSDAKTRQPIANFSLDYRGDRFKAGGIRVQNESGQFELADIAPGSYSFTASAENYESFSISNIAVAEGSWAEPLEFFLARLSSNTSSLQGKVLQPDGSLVSGILVRAVSLGSTNVTDRVTKTETDGSFQFASLSSGQFLISAESAFGKAEEKIELKAADQPKTVSLYLRPWGRLLVHVEPAENQNLVRVAPMISAKKQNAKDGTQWSSLGKQHSALTEAGKVFFEMLSPGKAEVTLWEGAFSDSGFPSDSAFVNIQEGQTTELHLTPRARVQFQGLLQDTNRNPLSNLFATLHWDFGSLSEKTDERGNFQFQARPGKYTLGISENWASEDEIELEIEIPEQSIGPKEIQIGRGRITGRIETAKGEGVFCKVVLKSSKGLQQTKESTSWSGDYTFGFLPPDEYSVTFLKGESAIALEPKIKISESELRFLRTRLP